MKPTFVALAVASVSLAFVISVGAPTASGADSGPTQTGPICMQKVFGTPVTNSNKLNCTANDIRLSKAISVSPTSCIKGTTIDLTATFETVVTANARYDAGFFFRIDGGHNARGDGATASGTCSLSALKPPPPPNPPALNLDGDTSGDLNSGTYNVTFTIPGVVCQDTDNDSKLDLPNCTSWHSNQGTVSNIGDAFTFNPDTKSKCVCDDTFNVPVTVEEATLGVVKTPSPIQVSEPGGEVTYNVDIKNNASVESVTIVSIIDKVLPNGVPRDVGSEQYNAQDNTCPGLINQTLAAGQTQSCFFKDKVSGNAGARVTDRVTATAYQTSTAKNISGFDDADVDIINFVGDANPSVDKTVQSTANCRLEATYQVVVSNRSTVDLTTVTKLDDDKFGDITQVQGNVLSTNCEVPKNIAKESNYTCSFTGRITSASCDITHVNKVTASLTDDDKVSVTAGGTATVTVDTTP